MGKQDVVGRFLKDFKTFVMKSPVNGKAMKLTTESREMEFRRETFQIQFHHYICTDTGEQFTSTALDELNLVQVYNQFRDRLNIPFPEEIGHIRKQYGVPASKMSLILGFGPNTYRLYEAGEVPSISNAKLIQMAHDPRNFMEMVISCDALDDNTRTKYMHKAGQLLEMKERNVFSRNVMDYFLGRQKADVYSGYRNPNIDKFTEMVVFFSEKLEPFKTKMNKLLFYADFTMFRHSCFSISGLRYVAINRGPVPNNFNSLFEYLAKNDAFDIEYVHFQNGYIGEKFKARNDRPFNPVHFTEKELETLNQIAERFKTTPTNDIVAFSHMEDAWKENHQERKEISYMYAFGMG